ncbi:unnamed protein product [Brassicogethes aeneus]|uniref:Uncharacterized protein n=1 Tax=Brassicogethes aeneus TaxID=1431903 RepID=A0A9P0ASF0_BRAAE|nr:unnamed protein product [Brassicogethes aeneus]
MLSYRSAITRATTPLLCRLISAQAEVMDHIHRNHKISSIKELFKWECDGGAGQSRYKQSFTNEDRDDSFLFFISMVPLVPTNYCRPIEIVFKLEKEEFIKNKILKIKNQTSLLRPSPVEIGGNLYNCTIFFISMMIDGKICSWLHDEQHPA